MLNETIPFVMEKCQKRNEYQNNQLYSTEVKWDISDLFSWEASMRAKHFLCMNNKRI